MDKPNNPPAFPQLKVEFGFVITDPLKPGVTLLDYFAAKAIQELIGEYTEISFVVKRAFDIAEAMLREREKRIQ